MPKVIVRYKDKKALHVLEDLGKQFDFKIIHPAPKKKKTKAEKKMHLLEQIREGLKEVKLIREGKIKPITMEELLNDL